MSDTNLLKYIEKYRKIYKIYDEQNTQYWNEYKQSLKMNSLRKGSLEE